MFHVFRPTDITYSGSPLSGGLTTGERIEPSSHPTHLQHGPVAELDPRLLAGRPALRPRSPGAHGAVSIATGVAAPLVDGDVIAVPSASLLHHLPTVPQTHVPASYLQNDEKPRNTQGKRKKHTRQEEETLEGRGRNTRDNRKKHARQ